MTAKKPTLPTFHSDRDEREFWSRHSVEEFAGALEDLEVVIEPPRTEQIALRLRPEDVEVLHQVAKQKGVGHTTLARSIVEQWVARWRQHTRRPRTSRRRRAA